MQPHRQQPTRLPRPWDSPGKNTGVGCHFLLQCMKVKSESEEAQSCPTLSDPMDCSPPGSSVRGIFQARVPEWGAIAFSKYHIEGSKNIKKLNTLFMFIELASSKAGICPYSESLWSRRWQPTPVFLPGESHGQRNLVGYSPWDHKEWDMTERLTQWDITKSLTSFHIATLCTSFSIIFFKEEIKINYQCIL